MIVLALTYDGLKALIDLITWGFLSWLTNPIINLWAMLTFVFWFYYLGVSFFKPGKMMGAKLASLGAPSLVGLLPWMGSLPFWTGGVIINLAAIYAEDLVETISPKGLGKIGQGLQNFKNRLKNK